MSKGAIHKKKIIFSAASLLLITLLSAANKGESRSALELYEPTLMADTTDGDTTQNVKYKPSKRPTYKAKDRYGDEFSNGKSRSGFSYKAPKSVKQKVEIDTSGKFYTVDEKMGDADFRPGTTMSYEQYKGVQKKETVKNFYKQKAKEKEEKDPQSKRALVPRIYMNPNLDRIFGGNYIDVKLNGSVLLDFGYQIQTVNNPNVPINRRTIGGFKFDQQIAVNAQAKIGERLKITINQDTKSQFDFDNNVKVEYNSLETDIIQKIEAGNVSMPINSSLITGAQNLFGIKAVLKFGRLTTTSILANQRGRQDEVKIQGGAQTKEFQIRADQYEDNKHYFLGQFFRDNYERALGTMPQINSGVIVTRVEVWVTNRNNTTDQLRNICSFMDLAENAPYNSRQIQSNYPNQVHPAQNEANSLWDLLKVNSSGSDSASINGIRRADNANLLTAPPFSFENGNDYEVIRNARRLKDTEFKFHPQLGYISLNAALSRDDVLSVAYVYSYKGKIYQVGELVENYSVYGSNASIFLKLLRPSTIRTDVPMWNLQMKNIYSLNSAGITRENFQLRVTYRDDLTQLNNPVLKFGGSDEDHGGIEGKPLLQVVGLDRLNMSNDPQPDGNFDYVESSTNAISPIQNSNPAAQNLAGGNTQNNATQGQTGTQQGLGTSNNINQNSALQANQVTAVTIDPQYGRIIFPVLEPFGKTMRKALGNDTIVFPEVLQKYVYEELYSKTKSDALQLSNKNKYFIVGRFQSTASDEIQLAGLNIPPGSVSVYSGSIPLAEGRDYTVDYNLGKVKIINPAYLLPGQQVSVKFEKSDLFQVRQRGFYGTRWDYVLNKDVAFGTTLLALNERPLVTRVAVGDEPINNTVWGFDGTFKRESGLITKMVDLLPVISTKEKSTIQATGEVATLMPGATSLVGRDGGTFYLDDFENTQIPYRLDGTPALSWKLGSTPVGMEGFGYNVNTNVLPFADNRAKIAWYTIDPIFYQGAGSNLPDYLNEQVMQNNYVRYIIPQNLFPQRSRQQIVQNEVTMDIAYYPSERGQYNYNPKLTPDGLLPVPANSFGAITRAVNNQDTDFDNANYQYLEFLMMDPFMADDRREVFNNPNLQNTGGKLQFHLGSISEDVIRDGRQEFEQGLPVPNTRPNASVNPTKWGYVTTEQYLTNSFSAAAGARAAQDIGLDGLDNAQEEDYFNGYINGSLSGLSLTAKDKIKNDPAADDFKHYLGTEQDNLKAKVVERYKNFNGMEGNSPDNTGTSFSAYTIPDNEDINQNNTLNDIEEYFKYEIDLKPEGLVVGKNNIVNVVTENVPSANGGDAKAVKWYLFRIPLREGYQKVGNIQNFKSIRFLRTVLTGWNEPVVLRLDQFQLVASQWRPYLNDLTAKDLKLPIEPDDKVFTVSQVNIEENAAGSSIPQASANVSGYINPPGSVRDQNYNNTVQTLLNEHSLRLNVTGLADDDARAVFKNYNNLNLLNYTRLKMDVHAEGDSNQTRDEDTRVFMRLGTDFTDNYYEIEIPLHLTKRYSNNVNPDIVQPIEKWLKENAFDFDLEKLSDKKLKRDAEFNVSKSQIYDAGYLFSNTGVPSFDSIPRQRVYIRGNPVYTNIQTIMIGIRNPKKVTGDDHQPKTVTIWVNDLRTAGIQNSAGWAATGRLNMKLADLGNVTATAKYTGAGFGGLEQKISQRLQENTTDLAANASLQMDKFIPSNNKIGIRLPLFMSISNKNISPKYDPINPDVKLEKSVNSKPDSVRAAYRSLVEDNTTNRSISLTNISKVKTKPGAKSYPFDIENLSATLSYSDITRQNINLAAYQSQNYKAGVGYNYSPKAPVLEPFKKAGGVFKSEYFKLIKDLNITLLPNSVSLRGDLDRTITRTQYSNGIVDGRQDIAGIAPTFEKRFLFNRNYALGWNITRSLSFNYSASTNALVDEPGGAINDMPAVYYIRDSLGNPHRTYSKRSAKDSVLYNLQNGGRIKTFNQNIRVNYKIPIDKVPMLNWVSSDASYSASYTWNAGAVGISDSLGNTAQNTRDITINARGDLMKLYSKSKFLAKVNMPPVAAPKVVKPSPSDTTKKKPPPPELNGLKGILRFLMMLQSVNATYQQTEGTVLPGYLGGVKYFGIDQDDSKVLHGEFLPFILGSQDKTIYENKKFANTYLSHAQSISNPINQNRTDNISGRASIVPFRDFKIQLDAKISASNSYQEIYTADYDSIQHKTLDTYNPHNPYRTGNYSISFIAIATHFVDDSANNENAIFHQLGSNRQIIKDRLMRENPHAINGIGYDTNSQDILIPAFLAAYSGRSASKQGLSSFPLIPLPNWRIDYAGLTNLFPALKALFPSISLTHAYQSTYSVNSYASNTQNYSDANQLSLSHYRDLQYASAFDPVTHNLIPINIINQVSIVERFAPLVGITLRTKSNMSFNFQYRRDRTVTLNTSLHQVTELKNQDITISYGYTKANMKLPFLYLGREIVLKNDVQMRADFTFRESTTIQRKFDGPDVVTQGNINFQIRPNVSYQVNQRLNLQLYFQYTLTVPKISTSFRSTTTAFGIQIRYSLS